MELESATFGSTLQLWLDAAVCFYLKLGLDGTSAHQHLLRSTPGSSASQTAPNCSLGKLVFLMFL